MKNLNLEIRSLFDVRMLRACLRAAKTEATAELKRHPPGIERVKWVNIVSSIDQYLAELRDMLR